MGQKSRERWGSGYQYERYVGRWSRLVAREFLSWLVVSPGSTWVDVGCGTGGLVEGILTQRSPHAVIGSDRSEGFASAAQRHIKDARAHFVVGDATKLPLDGSIYDVTVSGLVLNFVPDHKAMVREMARVTKSGGKVAAYVWDYAGGMEMMRHFWDAAVAVSPHAAKLDQGNRFPVCQPKPLRKLFQDVGLKKTVVRAINIPTVFRNFEEYWTPFLGNQGSAPTYLASVHEETQERIRELLQERLESDEDGTITMVAKAWAVQGTV